MGDYERRRVLLDVLILPRELLGVSVALVDEMTLRNSYTLVRRFRRHGVKMTLDV